MIDLTELQRFISEFNEEKDTDKSDTAYEEGAHRFILDRFFIWLKERQRDGEPVVNVEPIPFSSFAIEPKLSVNGKRMTPQEAKFEIVEENGEIKLILK